MPTTLTLAILIFDDVEVLDFWGPFEVLSVANRFTDPPAFNVLTVAEKAGPVVTRGGLSVNPHHLLADCPKPDLLLVPGGQGTRKEMHNSVLIDWIRQVSVKAELLLSVCTGALLLAKAGLLDGLEATSHHGAIDLLRQTAQKTTVHADRRFVDNGRAICSAGIAAGIDMSLHVVGRLLGHEVAKKTAWQMEYPWDGGHESVRKTGHGLRPWQAGPGPDMLAVPADEPASRYRCQGG
jgi:transcriptional regulator GlxA family with amidase domain